MVPTVKPAMVTAADVQVGNFDRINACACGGPHTHLNTRSETGMHSYSDAHCLKTHTETASPMEEQSARCSCPISSEALLDGPSRLQSLCCFSLSLSICQPYMTHKLVKTQTSGEVVYHQHSQQHSQKISAR